MGLAVVTQDDDFELMARAHPRLVVQPDLISVAGDGQLVARVRAVLVQD